MNMRSTANDFQRLTRLLCNSLPIGAATFAAPHSVGVQHEKSARFSHKNPRVFHIGAANL
jgi:hypothetical protein